MGGRTIAAAGSAAYLKYLQDMEASRRQRRPIVYVVLDTVMVSRDAHPGFWRRQREGGHADAWSGREHPERESAKFTAR